MSDVDQLIKAIAYDRAYAVAKDACDDCGEPATKFDGYYGRPYCDACPPKRPDDTSDLRQAKAVRRLMRIANGE